MRHPPDSSPSRHDTARIRSFVRRQLFERTRSADAILVFDEADALFGKRTTVADSHDRYANLEVAYILIGRFSERFGVDVKTKKARRTSRTGL